MKALSYSMMGLGAVMTVASGVCAGFTYRELTKYDNERVDIEQKIEGVKQERAEVGSRLEHCLAASNDCSLLSFKYESLTDKYNELEGDLSKNHGNRQVTGIASFVLLLGVFSGIGAITVGNMGRRDYTRTNLVIGDLVKKDKLEEELQTLEDAEKNYHKGKGEQ